MMLASFNMRKWRSNNAQLHAIWNAAENTKFNGDGMNSTLLGYIWNHEADKLKFRIKDELLKDPAEEITKRKILQVAGELYDPIGFISPFVVAAKMMMQECWQRGYQWDAPLDQELQNRFKTWYNEIPKLKNVEIPRHYFNNLSKGNLSNIQLHCFTDSSQKGYGAVVYLRYNENELTKTSFVMSKARVAPIKRVTLPRLELLGAVIGARLITYIRHSLKNIEMKIYMWTDSEIVLHWVKADPTKWKQFVRNRCLEIQEKTDPDWWNYCPSHENPSDLLTRGQKVETLSKNLTVVVWPTLACQR
ncbi:uncharacterized protein LOC118193755 [Stegodyphus dumicola]|uniref:uncharacterized protein LOC118193755 n=1 Tax=Stegodyphus dumicola TaxID=202533 RepID=UPI0015AC64B8|nr:uncharacterized protein LOC118193755 [Stegodyphus dumicola]